jgi:hypothetical protein
MTDLTCQPPDANRPVAHPYGTSAVRAGNRALAPPGHRFSIGFSLGMGSSGGMVP